MWRIRRWVEAAQRATRAIQPIHRLFLAVAHLLDIEDSEHHLRGCGRAQQLATQLPMKVIHDLEQAEIIHSRHRKDSGSAHALRPIGYLNQ